MADERGASQSQPESAWEQLSIYRVPTYLKVLNPKAYKPQVVSFGPYHHTDEDIKSMEQHKDRALNVFLQRLGATYEDVKKDLRNIVQSAMASYEELDGEWQDEAKFLDLMMRDGCFMLEVIKASDSPKTDYPARDPIFSSHGKLYNMPFIRRDMLLIENQIPLVVLQRLWDYKKENQGQRRHGRAMQTSRAINKGTSESQANLNRLILRFCTLKRQVQDDPRTNYVHILDMYHKSLLRPRGNSEQSTIAQSSTAQSGFGTPDTQTTSMTIIRSARELFEAGIRFKSRSSYLNDITFADGVLHLPSIIIDDTTEATFLNLMAFERLHVDAGNAVTSYIFFMDSLIDLEKDVSILHDKGIVFSIIGSDEAVAHLFNRLSKEVALNPESNIIDVRNRITKHCSKQWNKWRANLKHTYFSNPWTVFSLVAASVLLVLTILQTIYTVWGFYKPE